MSLENFKNRKIEWDTVNKNFDQSVQVISGDVNSRTVTIVITDKGEPIDLTGYSVKLVYKYIYNDNSGFVMLTPTDAPNGEFSLTIPTEMTSPGSIKSNLILLNENLEQVIVSKNLKFISDDSTVTSLAQEVNNQVDDFTKLLWKNMPQVMRSELDNLHAQSDSNTSNIDLKANLSDMTSLQSAMRDLENEVAAFGITPDNLITIKSLLDAIANNATDSEVAELINSVNILTNNISLMSDGDYSPKANKTDLESLQTVVNNQSATISTKANQTDLDNLQTDVTSQGIAISKKAEQSDLLITNQNVATTQTTANQAETDAQTAMEKATEAQANSLPLTGNAVSASKLATPRKLQVSLQASAFQNFDGTADVTNIGVSGILPVTNGGTGTSDGVINAIAYANSADGTEGFTAVYPNLNLLDGTKNFKPYGAGNGTINQNAGVIYFTQNKTVAGLFKAGDYITISCNVEFLNTELYSNSDDVFAQIQMYGGGFTWLCQVKAKNMNGKFYTRDASKSSVYAENPTHKVTVYRTIQLAQDIITANATVNRVQCLYNLIPVGANINVTNLKIELAKDLNSTATPYMQSSSEVTINDYPKYVGFSNIIKPNKTSSDYKWLPMGLVSIDSATGLLKPAVLGVDYAQAHPVGSVVSNSSNSASGYTTGTWQNIGSAVIGSATMYYWKRIS